LRRARPQALLDAGLKVANGQGSHENFAWAQGLVVRDANNAVNDVIWAIERTQVTTHCDSLLIPHSRLAVSSQVDLTRISVIGYHLLQRISGVVIRIAKWGDSLAVRLPEKLVEDLELCLRTPISIATKPTRGERDACFEVGQ